MAIQITQATITPNCRKKTDIIAIEEALNMIRKKLLFTMNASINDNATFKIVATLSRD